MDKQLGIKVHFPLKLQMKQIIGKHSTVHRENKHGKHV
jgi:hypothetical protein